MYRFEEHECAVAIQWGGIGNSPTYIQLPCYPEEASESISASWAETSVVGRTGHLHAYTGANDIEYSFSFDLHRDMEYYMTPSGVDSNDSGGYIDKIVRIIKSGCYPDYSSGLKPPRVYWKFGNMHISGMLKNVTFAWKAPIIEGAYALCTVNVQMASAHTEIIGKDTILSSSQTTTQGTSLYKETLF